jgi:hypothetical protein
MFDNLAHMIAIPSIFLHPPSSRACGSARAIGHGATKGFSPL